jgi:ABC-2 type transport system ATP-binding protein
MDPPPAARIFVRNLSRCYGSVRAVQALSLEVLSGEIFGLLGLNGAGKTTTLECILGLRRPDAGTIILGELDSQSDPVRARQRVGALLQFDSLPERMTPREALRFFGSFYERATAPDALLEQFALTAKADVAFASLSAGQQQRLFLALALINQPEVIILDEPTAGLDPRARRDMHQLLTTLRAEGRAVLLSTHYLDEAQLLCDRVGILHEGRLIAVDSPAGLLARAQAGPRIEFRTARTLDEKSVAALPGVISLRPCAGGWQLATRDPSAMVGRLARQLEADGNRLLEITILAPTLEDVFLELTGQDWPVSAGEPIP